MAKIIAVNLGKKEQVQTGIVLSSLEKKAAPLFKKLNHIGKIDSQESFDLAANLVKQLKELGKLAEGEKKHLLEPVKEVEKRIREHFKPFEKRLVEIEDSVKLAMSLFLEGNKKKLAKVDQDFEEGKIRRVGTYTNKVSELQVHSNSAQVRKVKKLEIVDFSKIPREYLIPDEAKIMEALKCNTEVPGCRIVTVDQIAI